MGRDWLRSGVVLGALVMIFLLWFALGDELFAQGVVDFRVPSSGCGMGGSLAVRAYTPPPLGMRFAGFAGQVVYLHGGTDGGNLELDGVTRAVVREGIVVVRFLFPGTSWRDPASGVLFTSDGVYDDRGPHCIEATRDVARFSLGTQADTTGAFVAARVPGALTSNVGLYGSSNGGSIAFATMDRFGGALAGLKYFAGFENPSIGQYVVGDLGTKTDDPDAATDGNGNGILTDDGTNPAFWLYHPTVCDMEWGRLAYDAALQTDLRGTLYNGLAWFEGGAAAGCTRALVGVTAWGTPLYDYDMDGSGMIDGGEDFPLSGAEGTFGGVRKLTYSLPTRTNLAAFPLTADVATLAETRTFWGCREKAPAIPNAAVALPGLACIDTSNQSDHVQAAHDGGAHMHVQASIDQYRAAGLWHRVNPDRAYVRSIYVRWGAALPMGVVDNDANLVVALGGLHAMSEPPTAQTGWVNAAAILELADRTQTGNWAVNLPGLLVMPPP